VTPDLRQLLAEVRGRYGTDEAVERLIAAVEGLVAAEEAREEGPDGRLVKALARVFAVGPFTAAQVVERAPALPLLAAALAEALGAPISARRLGRRLSELADRPFSGWRVEAGLKDWRGTAWRLRLADSAGSKVRVASPESPTQRTFAP